jgi:general secretion pathway protein A
MYLEHFGLRELPFSLAPDPRYLYLSAQHREALAHLLYGVQSEGGFVQLTGEVGTGKTTVCRCFLEQLPKSTRAAVILNPSLTAEDLLAAICDEFEIPRPGGPSSLKASLDSINRFLLDAHAAGERAVLIVDEAQNLDPVVLEQVRLLTNLETSRHKLLQIILMGQPELRATLARSDLRQLAQRITARFHLQPLSREETAAYVRHRLGVAGCHDELFPPAVIGRLQRLSRGVPRLINILCDRSLLGAYVQGRYRVDRATLDQAAREVAGKTWWEDIPWRPIAVAVGGCALVAAIWLAASARRPAAPVPAPAPAVSAPVEPANPAAPATAPQAAAESLRATPLPAVVKPAPPAATPRGGQASIAPTAPTAPASPANRTGAAKAGTVASPSPASPPAATATPVASPDAKAGLSPSDVAPPGTLTAAVSEPDTATHPPATVLAEASAPTPEAPAAAGPVAADPVSSAPHSVVPLALQALMEQAGAQREEDAWRWLYRLWGIRARDGVAGCTQSLVHGLDCLRGAGGLQQLRLLNRPAIVRVYDQHGAPRWLVFERVREGEATLAAGGARATVDVAGLDAAGIRDFALLWRPPGQTGGTLAVGDEGPGVAWLARRLDATLGAASGVGSSQVFDAALADRVRDYQRSRGLSVDGIAGPVVLLSLDTDPEPGTPRLVAPRR